MHLIFYDTSPLKVFMQMCTFVNKSSLLSTRALSIIYEDSERNLVSFVDELFTNETAELPHEKGKTNAHRHISSRL